MKKSLTMLVLILLAAGLFGSGQKGVIYVDSHSDAKRQNGKSWKKAYSNLSEALGEAEAGDEIWVAAGTYTPTYSRRSISFYMRDDVDIYGGFIGTESERSQRNWEKNVTILSGEINNPSTVEDNSLTVVMAANNILDGFTITGGNGTGLQRLPQNQQSGMEAAASGMQGPPQGQQGSSSRMQVPPPGQSSSSGRQGPPSGQSSSSGMLGTPPDDEDSIESESADSEGSADPGHLSPEIILSGGSIPGTGSGIHIWQVSPEIRNCIITDNHSHKAGGVYIVGKAPGKPSDTKDEDPVMPVFISCTISDNTASGRGGGAALDLGGSALFIDTVFSGNSCTEGKGGAIYNDFGCSPYIVNCLFTDNSAESGGAIGNDGESNPVIYNTTFYGNKASAAGAALYQGSGPFNDPAVVNSIIWGNICLEDEAGIYNWNDCNPSVSYSIVEGGYTGEAVLDQDPLFTDPSSGNFKVSAESPALRAGREGGRIGYNPGSSESGAAADIEKLKNLLSGMRVTGTPRILDLTNKVSASEAENIGDLISLMDGSTLYLGSENSFETRDDGISLGRKSAIKEL